MTEPAKPKRGRPPLEDTALLAPKTVRFSKPMVREIEAIRAERALEQPDFGQVVRELRRRSLGTPKEAVTRFLRMSAREPLANAGRIRDKVV